MAAERTTYGGGGRSGATVVVEDLTLDLGRLGATRAEQAVQALTIDATNRMLDLVTAETVTEGATGAFKGRSAAGQPPFQDTGRLADSIPEARTVVVKGDQVIGTVGANVAYAVLLELGTRLMRPRPFLRPALAATADDALATLRRVFSGRGRS